MQPTCAIIFDLDGVLVETAHLHFRSWVSVAAEHGVRVSAKLESQLRGISREKSYALVFANSGVPDRRRDEICAEKNARYNRGLESLNAESVSAELRTLLDRMRADGIVLCIASGSRNAKRIVERTSLDAHFEFVLDGNLREPAKPSAEYYEHVAELAGADPENCLLVEDAPSCLEAGARAGMKGIAVNCPREIEAELHVKNITELTRAHIDSLFARPPEVFPHRRHPTSR